MNKEKISRKDIKEISIAIDNWDDIFSDFDPRPLGERVLSEDFLAELKKRYRESRSGKFFIAICAPQSLKDEKAEKTVIQRLKRDFKQKYLQSQKEISSLRLRGTIFILLGILFLNICGRYYRKFGFLESEDYTNAHNSPVQNEILSNLRYIKSKVDENIKYK